ncbi:hypothetical protein [Streptomyces sp. NPDC047024]|uniref:hypothetical protein n=1 Tax=Streptomyces sp. NPDC047024 TaxID=3155476 RepID=UPI0033D65D46
MVPCLADGERAVRRAALRAVAAVAVAGLLSPEVRASVTARFEALYADDPAPVVRADAMVVLNLLGRELLPLDSESPECRLAAAVLTAERSGPPYPAGLVEIFARDGSTTNLGTDTFPWPGDHSSDGRLTRLLSRDPDAALTVAARWITAGDPDSRGSWLAGRILTTWRDREPQAIALLHASLPHQKDTRALAYRLSMIGDWITHLPEPGLALRDTLYAHAHSEDPEITRPALLALIRARDSRALELVLRAPRRTRSRWLPHPSRRRPTVCYHRSQRNSPLPRTSSPAPP